MKHLSYAEHNARIAAASQQVLLGGIYKHYKFPDRDYKVLGFVIQEDTLKIAIRYRNILDDEAPEFVRDLGSWLETVQWEGKSVPRFVLAPTK